MTWSRLRLCFGSLVAGSFIPVPQLRPREEATQFGVFEDAITTTENMISRAMVSHNIPGACCVVKVNGRTVMRTGFGYSDVENLVPFSSRTSMRIASISKVITAMITLRLVEEGVVKLDEPLGGFLATHGLSLSRDGRVEEGVTVRQLLNHTAGVRHYHTNKDGETGDSASDEFYSSINYPTVSDSLEMFIRDDLASEPGTNFNYTTFGYSLLSFVLEKTSEKDFEKLVSEFKSDLGLRSLLFDRGSALIPHRCRYYSRAENGVLQNTPAVDLSCKWAGGGLVSNAEDIAKLGDVLLFLLQDRGGQEEKTDPGEVGTERSTGYLSVESIRNMTEYNPVTVQRSGDGTEGYYGLGLITQPTVLKHGGVRQFHRVTHTGGAVGACSVLMVVPLPHMGSHGQCCMISSHDDHMISRVTDSEPALRDTCDVASTSVSGITVVLFCNHEKGGPIIRLADQIAAEFLDSMCI